jgi:predicted MFS family arabinose efflux permease
MSELREDLHLVITGAAMIAVTFGLARYGYGLLLPAMQRDVHVGVSTAGVIASSAYLSYLAGNTVVVWMLGRFGARVPIAAATATAVGGMALIALAHGTASLWAGVVTAGAAAGLAFPPYADIVARAVAPARREVGWSTISSGTGWGVAVAGPLAILLGERWRWCWLLFAILAAAVGVWAFRAAPAPSIQRTSAHPPTLSWSWFVCPRSRPLLISALLIGLGSSIWWAFSLDALQAAGLTQTLARIVYAVCGAAGVLASLTGFATRRFGARRCYLVTCALLSAALAAVAFAATSITAVLVAATAFGLSYNGVVAVQGLWNGQVFKARPSAGLAAVNTALTCGTIIGPTIAGATISQAGYPVAFIIAAATTGIASLQMPPRLRWPTPVHSPPPTADQT